MKILTKDGIITKTNYEYYCDKYGKKEVDNWLQNVKMSDLMRCMEAFSNDSFVDYNLKHRNKELNALEMILQETPQNLYRTATYGVCPNDLCTSAITKITNRIYGNCDIAIFLIQEKIKELKAWLLENHNFSEEEKRLLHYFNE